MKPNDPECKLFAHLAVKWMRKNRHTKPDNVVTRSQLAEAVGFKPGQWPMIRDAIMAAYPLCPVRGRNGGFYIGKRGAQATMLKTHEEEIVTRIETVKRHRRAIAETRDWKDGKVLDFADNTLKYDLRKFGGWLGAQVTDLALPAPSMN
jgi:hypothetical protein